MHVMKSGCIYELAWAAFRLQLQAVLYSTKIKRPSKMPLKKANCTVPAAADGSAKMLARCLRDGSNWL